MRRTRTGPREEGKVELLARPAARRRRCGRGGAGVVVTVFVVAGPERTVTAAAAYRGLQAARCRRLYTRSVAMSNLKRNDDAPPSSPDWTDRQTSAKRLPARELLLPHPPPHTPRVPVINRPSPLSPPPPPPPPTTPPTPPPTTPTTVSLLYVLHAAHPRLQGRRRRGAIDILICRDGGIIIKIIILTIVLA